MSVSYNVMIFNYAGERLVKLLVYGTRSDSTLKRNARKTKKVKIDSDLRVMYYFFELIFSN